jgi:hypothetical protein
LDFLFLTVSEDSTTWMPCLPPLHETKRLSLMLHKFNFKVLRLLNFFGVWRAIVYLFLQITKSLIGRPFISVGDLNSHFPRLDVADFHIIRMILCYLRLRHFGNFEEQRIHQEMFEQQIFDAYSIARLYTSVLAKSRVHPLLA